MSSLKILGSTIVRRIAAWILLVLFVLLIVNLMIFRMYLTESVIAYGTIVALFFFLKGFGGREKPEFETEGEEEDVAGAEEGRSSERQE